MVSRRTSLLIRPALPSKRNPYMIGMFRSPNITGSACDELGITPAWWSYLGWEDLVDMMCVLYECGAA